MALLPFPDLLKMFILQLQLIIKHLIYVSRHKTVRDKAEVVMSTCLMFKLQKYLWCNLISGKTSVFRCHPNEVFPLNFDQRIWRLIVFYISAGSLHLIFGVHKQLLQEFRSPWSKRKTAQNNLDCHQTIIARTCAL